MKVRVFSVGVGGILGFVLLLVGWQVLGGGYRYQGSLIDPPVPATDFTLTDQNGGSFKLSEQRGRAVLIFFGYTNCPDVCPVTLSNFMRIKEALGDQAQRVRFVFITVDPERDTRERLQQHLSNYDPEFIGLTGTRGELEKVWQSYGVYQARHDEGSAAGYVVDHTSRTYLIDPHGNWLLTYPFEMDRQAIVDDLDYLLKLTR
jgi:protein SCO1/2